MFVSAAVVRSRRRPGWLRRIVGSFRAELRLNCRRNAERYNSVGVNAADVMAVDVEIAKRRCRQRDPANPPPPTPPAPPSPRIDPILALKNRLFNEVGQHFAAMIERASEFGEKNSRCGRFVDGFPRSCSCVPGCRRGRRTYRCRCSFPSRRDRRTCPARRPSCRGLEEPGIVNNGCPSSSGFGLRGCHAEPSGPDLFAKFSRIEERTTSRQSRGAQGRRP